MSAVPSMLHLLMQQSACDTLLSGHHPKTKSGEVIAAPHMLTPQTRKADDSMHSAKMWCKTVDVAAPGGILTMLHVQRGTPKQTVIQGAVDAAITAQPAGYRRRRIAPKVLEVKVSPFCSRGQMPRAVRMTQPVHRQSQAAVGNQQKIEGARAISQGKLRLLGQAINSTLLLQPMLGKGMSHLGPMEVTTIIGSR